MKQLAFVLVASCLALGCSCSRSGSDAPAGPAQSAGTSAAQPPPVGGDVARPTRTELPALAVGQWSKYRNTSKDGATEVTYKVVAEEDGGYWLEVVRGAANAGTVLQMLISIKNRSDPNSLDVHAARIRMPNGHVRELRGDMLRPTADGYRKSLAEIFAPSLAGAPQEDVSVPAGNFHGCYKRTQKVERQSKASEQTVWVHTDVPISGIVKSEETDGSGKTELLTWGTSGAKSELNAKPTPEE
jgi:hypothetical protein